MCRPAAMSHTEFLRSDELPGDAALGYLTDDSARTNVFHIPVIGGGDGRIYSTAAELPVLAALFAGQIVPERARRGDGTTTKSGPAEPTRYGLGFWLHASSDVVMLEGYDAGVSFRTMHDPVLEAGATVIANTSEGAWPFVELLEEQLAT